MCLSADAAEVFVPAGPFFMGCREEAELGCPADELPRRRVDVPAFAMDRTEVTATAFAAFLEAEGNDCPDAHGFCGFCLNGAGLAAAVEHTEDGWQAAAGYADTPAFRSSWYGARAYCAWAGRRLCSEAEWEKAARGGCPATCGPDDDVCCQAAMRLYPWGDDPPTCEAGLANFDGCAAPPAPECQVDGTCIGVPIAVGSFPAGASPFGALDMAGNVWEYVEDCHHDSYEGGPEDGAAWNTSCFVEYAAEIQPVARGGSYSGTAAAVRAGNRASTAHCGSEDVGFRCCRSVP